MSLCPEADLRAAMTDAEFWDHVFHRGEAPDQDDEWDAIDDARSADLTACPECGEHGACAFDDEGRALIHVIPEDEEVAS